MDNAIKNQVKSVLSQIYQNGIIWKSKKDVYHLNKRKSRAHIPEGWQLNDYNILIMNILKDSESDIYIFLNKPLTKITLSLLMDASGLL